MANPVLVVVNRGKFEESRHRGAACAVDSRGRVVAAWGNVDTPVVTRSAIKPLQALPFIESGAFKRYALGTRELALACASHSGEVRHVRRIALWLDRLNLPSSILACGAHRPLSTSAADDLVRANLAPTRLHNNCSGKHLAFLTTALHWGAAAAGYEEKDHPVQRRVRQTVLEMCEAEVGGKDTAIDGCGVPTFALPLRSLALAFSRLGHPRALPAHRAEACMAVSAAMLRHPYLVGGAQRFDTEIMEALDRKTIVKSGAEGISAAAIPSRNLGVAIKIDDGANRGAQAAMAALLLRFARLSGTSESWLKSRAHAPLRNTTGQNVGTVEARIEAWDLQSRS